MNSILLFLAGLFVLALSALFAAPHFVDWNDHRNVFEAQATKLIGRGVKVGGDVGLSLFPSPVLRFEEVAVADTNGKFETPFASAGSVTVGLSVPPLLRGTIEARSIELVEPVVNLRLTKEGTGNWTNLGGEAGSLPFIANDVALNSVQLDNATINIWRDKPEPDTVLSNFAGELSSRGLQGPYKFIGTFVLAGKERELRFSTGKPKEDGEFRLSLSVRSPEVGDSFKVDGAVRGLKNVPIFKGTLNANLSDGSSDGNKTASPAPIQISSDVYVQLTDAQFENFQLTINRNEKPQTVSGLMNMGFERGVVVDGTFSSRLLDIDSWFEESDPERSSLRAALGTVTQGLYERLSTLRLASLKLFFDQVQFGGDLSKKVQANLIVSDSKVEIKRLSARLPGDNRLRLSGSLAREEAGVAYRGPASVSGNALSRFLRWTGVAKSSDLAVQQDDFAISAEVEATSKKVGLTNIEGELSGSEFAGSIQHEQGDPGTLVVQLDSEKLDLSQVIGGPASARAFIALLKRDSPQAPDTVADAPPAGVLGATRANFNVNIGAVALAGLGESSVNMDVSLGNDSIDIKQFQLKSGSDVEIRAGGSLSSLDRKPDGNITLAVQAKNAKGVSAIGSFLEFPLLAQRSGSHMAALTPLQLTAAIRSSASEQGGLDAQVEGLMGKSDLKLKMDLIGEPATWRDAQVGLQASLANASGTELLQQLRPSIDAGLIDAFSGGAGTVSLEASGIPKQGIDTKFIMAAGGADLTVQGQYKADESAATFDGAASLSAKNTQGGLALLGVRVPEAHGTEALQASADMSWADGSYTFKNAKGEIGGAVFEGNITADRSSKTPKITADIRASEASLVRLFAPVLNWSASDADANSIRGVTATGDVWPKVPFNPAFMKSLDGKVSLRSTKMHVIDKLSLDDANLEATLANGRFAVSSLQGRAYGGTVEMSGHLEARGAGATLTMKGDAKGLQLAELTEDSSGNSLLTAAADVTLSLSGEGLTPLGLVSGLSGQGELKILDGDVQGFSLGAAHKAAVAAQEEKGSGIDEATLSKRVTEQLSASGMGIGEIKAPFNVGNGIVEFDKIAMSDSEGRVIIASFVQLANMQLDSEWALQSANAIEGSKPRVSLVFSGPLNQLGKLPPKVDTAGLARFVTIQRMKKDVERLEKLDVSGNQQKKPAQDQAKLPDQSTPAPSPSAASPAGTPAETQSASAPPVTPVIPGQEPATEPIPTPDPAAASDTTQPTERANVPLPVRKPRKLVRRPPPPTPTPSPAAEPRPAVSTDNGRIVIRPQNVPSAVTVTPDGQQPGTAPRQAAPPSPPGAANEALPWTQNTTSQPSNPGQAAAASDAAEPAQAEPQPEPPVAPQRRSPGFDPFASEN